MGTFAKGKEDEGIKSNGLKLPLTTKIIGEILDDEVSSIFFLSESANVAMAFPFSFDLGAAILLTGANNTKSAFSM